ncbi:MAG: hypothetical protein ACI8T1_004369 [Verrucomicrobiales bacterium]|jgi:hypothetical protein
MIYQNTDIKTTGIVLGVALVATHIVALLNGKSMRPILKDFPRNRAMGVLIMTINALWAYWIVSSMDLGEFSALRVKILIAIPIAYLLVVFFVEEFLSVRALGTLMLLAACVVLDAAWFKVPETMAWTKLLLPILAYAWIILGMFWVGMPYLMRDQISWLSHNGSRWKSVCIGGLLYGLLTLGCAIAFWS